MHFSGGTAWCYDTDMNTFRKLALAGLLVALPLSAATVKLPPVAIATSLQSALNERYGADEGAVLEQAVTQSLGRALKAAGASLDAAAALRIEVSIEDAVPTHPTRWQLQRNPSLDYLRSVSRGGAHLVAVLRGANGQIIDRVDYDHYAMSIEDASLSGSAWGDAMLTIDRFAAEVVKAWRRHRDA